MVILSCLTDTICIQNLFQAIDANVTLKCISVYKRVKEEKTTTTLI